MIVAKHYKNNVLILTEETQFKNLEDINRAAREAREFWPWHYDIKIKKKKLFLISEFWTLCYIDTAEHKEEVAVFEEAFSLN